MNSHAGQLTDRVEFQTPTQWTDASGQPSVTWATYKTVWAECLPATVRERMLHDKPEAVADWKIKIRYASWITQQMRAVYDSRTLEITAITFDKARQWHTVLCREVA